MKRRTLSFLALGILGLACWSILRKPTPDPMRIEVFKAARRLEFHDGFGAVKKYRVALGFNPTGHKSLEGDGATPEGEYFVCVKKPRSAYFLSLGISYPGPRDAERGLASGVISPSEHAEILRAHAEGRTPPWKTALGGEIFIHGHGSQSDWTSGCVALDDADMTGLYELVEIGTPVVVKP